MRPTTRLGLATLVAAAAVFAVAGASASAFGGPPGHYYPLFGSGSAGVVFVQNDDLAGNQIVAYDRLPNGTLTQAGVYPTGGLGGQLEGSVVDHLASQGSLAYDQADGLLYAVNARSDTISVFAVFGDHLALRQVLGSGGSFPVSIAVHDGLVYVLDAGDGGSVQGFFDAFGRLQPIPGSGRALGLNPAALPQFTHTPGQVAFSPDGSQLIVTTKENGSDIDVFRVFASGQLSPAPVVNPEPGEVPFAVSFDGEGNLVVAEAAGALASFRLSWNGTLTQLDSVATEQAATCWVAPAGDRFYTSNAGSASLTGFQSGFGGALTLLGDTKTDAGTVDAAASGDARFLYVQTGAAGIVDEFAIGAGGALGEIGSVTVPGAIGGEGIAVG